MAQILKDMQREIKQTFESLGEQLGEDVGMKASLEELENMQETLSRCLKEMLVEVEETEKLLNSRRKEVESEIQIVKNCHLENKGQIWELQRGMKTHDEIIGKLKETPNTIVQLYFEEVQATLDGKCTDMKKKAQDLEMKKQQLQFRLDELEKEMKMIAQDNYQIEKKKKTPSHLKKMTESLILKANQNMLLLAVEKKLQKEQDGNKIMDLKKQLELLSNSKDREIRELKEDLESNQSLNQNLITAERTANDEIQDARKALVDELSYITPSRQQTIYVKRMGELDVEAFCSGVRKKRTADGVKSYSAVELCSLWENHVRDVSWHPFKVITENDKSKEVLNEDDERLKDLKSDLGKEAYEAVVSALKEMNEYNPSGHYPLPYLWNGKEERPATLREGIEFLIEQSKPRRKKAR